MSRRDEENGSSRESGRTACERYHFDRIANSYSLKDLVPASRTARRHRLARTVAAAPLPPAMDVLEVGCGAGFAAEYLQGSYRTYLGVDCSAQLVELARRHNPYPGVSFETADIDDFEISRVFDAVLMIGVLHHLDDMAATVSKIRTLLKPGGWLLVNEPQPANPLVRIARRLRKRLDSTYSSEQRELTASEISRTLAGAGLVSIRTHPQGIVSTPFAEVVLRPQWLMEPLSQLCCGLDSFLERTLGSVLGPVAWNVIVAARRPAQRDRPT